jgi:hypothetical protein
MAGTGGYRPGAGRPKGSVNSQSVKLQERALASGYAPLDVLLGMMRWYYEKAERLLRPTTSALGAVEKVFAQGYDTHPATFVRALADLGFIIGNCPGWFAAWSARLTVAGQGLLGA